MWWSDRTKVKKVNYERQMVTVAVQPAAVSENPIVATGDVEGRILLWYNLLGRPKSDEDKYFTSTVDGREVQKTSLHWHAHAVTCMAFTNDGNYLLSGGEEAVLVYGKLERQARRFCLVWVLPYARFQCLTTLCLTVSQLRTTSFE